MTVTNGYGRCVTVVVFCFTLYLDSNTGLSWCCIVLSLVAEGLNCQSIVTSSIILYSHYPVPLLFVKVIFTLRVCL